MIVDLFQINYNIAMATVFRVEIAVNVLILQFVERCAINKVIIAYVCEVISINLFIPQKLNL